MGRTGNAKAKKEQEDLLVSWKGPVSLTAPVLLYASH